jgi:hypothetical protein
MYTVESGSQTTQGIPTASYGTASMATSGKTVVIAATGSSWMNHTRKRQVAMYIDSGGGSSETNLVF